MALSLDQTACPYCIPEESESVVTFYSTKALSDHILEKHPDAYKEEEDSYDENKSLSDSLALTPADHDLLDDDVEAYLLSDLFDEEEDSLAALELLLNNIEPVADPGADVAVDVLPDPGAHDIDGAQIAADAFAMLEQVLPAMVHTFAVDDLTAVKTWLIGVFGVTDVELLIHDQFLVISSVTLDFHVEMDLLDPVSDEPSMLETDPAVVVSNALSEILPSAAAVEAAAAAAAALMENINEELEQGLSDELLTLKEWFEDLVGPIETTWFVKCLICPEISPNLTHALAHIQNVHFVLSPEEEEIKSRALAFAVDDLTRTRNPSAELLKWLNFRFIASLAIDLVRKDSSSEEDGEDSGDDNAELVIPAMASTHAVGDFSALKAWIEGAFQVTDVELRMQDQFLVLSSVSLHLQIRVNLLDSLGNLETESTMFIPGLLEELFKEKEDEDGDETLSDLCLGELFKEKEDEDGDETLSDLCLRELFMEEEDDEVDDNRYFMTYEEWLLYTGRSG